MYAAVSGITPAALPEVGANVVELSPADCHLAEIGRVNGNSAFVRGVADNILAVLIDVNLITGEYVKLRDHSRRGFHFLRRRRRVIVYFQRLIQRPPVHRSQLG